MRQSGLLTLVPPVLTCVARYTWRERLAGILLASTAVGQGIHIGVVAGHHHILVWSMLGLPYLVAGVLLLNSWWLFRKTP